MKFSGLTADRPLNVIGSVVRTERLTPLLYLVAVRFDAVPAEDPVTPIALAKNSVQEPAPASISAHSAASASNVPATAGAAFPTFDEPQSDTSVLTANADDAELARIRAAVLF